MRVLFFIYLMISFSHASAEINLGDFVIDTCTDTEHSPLIQVAGILNSGGVLSTDQKLYTSSCIAETVNSYRDYEVGKKVLARIGQKKGVITSMTTTIKAIDGRGFIMLQDNKWYNPIHIQVYDESWGSYWRD